VSASGARVRAPTPALRVEYATAGSGTLCSRVLTHIIRLRIHYLRPEETCMPASREVTFRKRSDATKDMVSISVSGDLERNRSVYFTDQDPEFDIQVTNISGASIGGRIIARVEFDESNDDYGGEHASIEVGLNPGETTTGILNPDIMSYQGHAAVRIDTAGVRESDGDYDYEVSKKSGNRRVRAYTFMVYDRDYYRVNYLLPRYAQYLAAFLSVLIVGVGIIQITAS